eukprot:GHVL01010420.1.p1 GENE.GHVL01010420.1~~GHVL01010420.1.p1  ORF type:complete len:221 (-),score=22.71 GHVL01010420.1:355-1017(-)
MSNNLRSTSSKIMIVLVPQGPPQEYSMFVDEFKKHGPDTIWIMKPVGKSQGKGIFLFDKLSAISEWRKYDKPDVQSYVVQRYIHNPLLLGGKKFDLRLYVLVTNFSPLTVWVHRSGFGRFSSTYFSLEKEHLTDPCIHLTNVSIQKKTDGYDEATGGKWIISKLKQHLITRFGNVEVSSLFLKIQNVILTSLKCVEKTMINDKHSYELYGYDILIDSDLK